MFFGQKHWGVLCPGWFPPHFVRRCLGWLFAPVCCLHGKNFVEVFSASVGRFVVLGMGVHSWDKNGRHVGRSKPASKPRETVYGSPVVTVKGAEVKVKPAMNTTDSNVNFDVEVVDVPLAERQAAFAVWLAEPEDFRVPSSMSEMAAVLGVSEVTVWRWSKRPDVQMAVRYLILQNMGSPDRIANILDMYYECAMDAGLPAKVRLAAGEKYTDAVGLKWVWNGGSGSELLNRDSSGLDLAAVPTEKLREMLQQNESDGPQSELTDGES